LNAPVPVVEIAGEKLVSAKLTGIEALLLTSRARSNTTVATRLAWAVLISLTAVGFSILTGSPIVTSRVSHGFNLISQPLYLIHKLSLILPSALLIPLLRLPHPLACLLELLAQFRESLGDLVFSAPGGWIDTTPQPVRRSLHAVVEI
jgi:hypothetical protein